MSAFLGTIYLWWLWLLFKLGIVRFLIISAPDLLKRHILVKAELVERIKQDADFYIACPETERRRFEAGLTSMAASLQSQYRVLIYIPLPPPTYPLVREHPNEGPILYSLDPSVVAPAIEIGKTIVEGVVVSALYDVLKQIVAHQKQFPVEMFEITRNHNGVRYHYSFNYLTAETALQAAKLIPAEALGDAHSENASVYEHKYFHFNSFTGKWSDDTAFRNG